MTCWMIVCGAYINAFNVTVVMENIFFTKSNVNLVPFGDECHTSHDACLLLAVSCLYVESEAGN